MPDMHVFMWRLVPGEKVSEAIIDAAVEFELDIGIKAEFAFIRQIPNGAEEFDEVKGITLIQAGWVPVGQVVISGMGLGFDYRNSPAIDLMLKERMNLQNMVEGYGGAHG